LGEDKPLPYGVALVHLTPYLARDVRYKGGPQTHHPLSGEVGVVLPEAEASGYVRGEDKPHASVGDKPRPYGHNRSGGVYPRLMPYLARWRRCPSSTSPLFGKVEEVMKMALPASLVGSFQKSKVKMQNVKMDFLFLTFDFCILLFVSPSPR